MSRPGALPDCVDRQRYASWWRRELAALGVRHPESALERVASAVENVLADERGRWLLSSQREEADCEFPVSSLLPDGRLAEYQIDRVFVEDEVRWVVDYKSSVPDSGQSRDAFIDEQLELHRNQLEDYRQLMTALEGREEGGQPADRVTRRGFPSGLPLCPLDCSFGLRRWTTPLWSPVHSH